jgi:hypothetical protein
VKHSLVYLAVVALVCLSSTTVHACAVPSAAGVAICTPGNGQSVAYPANITAAATPNAGRHITAIAVYANGSRILLQNGVNQVNDIDYSLKAGSYSLVVSAWDETGQIYSSHRTFSVVGGEAAACTPPAPGILFCSPANGSLQPTNNITANVGARGNNSPITRMQVLIDGQLMQDGAMSNLQFTAGFGNAGTHNFTAKAWDKAGHYFAATTQFKTYYDGICSPKGCAPGVFIQSPSDGDPVSTSFAVRADVENNPAPITSMKAYIGSTLVATSYGPTMIAQVSAARGTHVLTIQAWDTQGKLYRTVETITVQ